ncbi:hypothetical protein [Sulfitobacter sp. S190]|uniref:hypothetical protein n=1 Tax=Sulfitobacter sp. S190 TaxID=2867022 RepID=UPI0021A3080B|nr:hypothetical protein [Sulfitobacter sp. S190]UWR21876.1 hypothetical protein K3756_14480 [Sulfitobacter sp. S190]
MALARVIEIPKRIEITPTVPDLPQAAAIDHLRAIAARVRSAPRTDLFEACAVLASDRTKARDAGSEVLIRCLGQGLGHAPVFFRPGTPELSFDEAWLAQALRCATRGDRDSLTFLVYRRIAPCARRNLGALIADVARMTLQT